MIYESKKRYNLMITLTEQCNLKCMYCYEKNKSAQCLSVKAIKEHIENMFNSLDVSNELVISFHGGEPLIAFECIKQVCEWVWGKSWKCNYTFFATTNGTLLTVPMKEWFANNRNRFSLGLSYDGTDQMQDLNRSNSSSMIDKEFFKHNWPNQPIKMTLSKRTVGSLAEGIISLHELGFSVNANLAFGTEWNMEESLSIFSSELLKLANYYIANPQILPCSLLDMKLSLIAKKSVQNKHWCGSGRYMKAISPDGKEYPCQMFMPSSMSSEPDIFPLEDALKKEPLVSPKCKKCFLESVCPTCYRMNLIVSGDLSIKPDDYCKMMKIRALACSYLYGKMLSSKIEYALFSNCDEKRLRAYYYGIYTTQIELRRESWLKIEA